MLLAVEDLRTQFHVEEGIVPAVDGVSFHLDAGKTLGIVGESGCGKSVTAMSVLRLLPMPPARIVSGSVLFEGENLIEASQGRLQELRGNQIGMIFQEPMTSLNPVFTIGEQITEAILTHNEASDKKAAESRALELLHLVGIADPRRRFSDYPHRLSGGMRQRVMIAMALSCRPKLLIADEPTTALDVTIQAQILELIARLQRELNMAMILITHDLGVIAQHADDVMVMYAGKVVEKASVESLFEKPLHPYTQGLLASLPSSQQFGKPLTTISGNVPSLLALPRGCAFQDRCPSVQDHCRKEEPVLEKKQQHRVSCFEVKSE